MERSRNEYRVDIIGVSTAAKSFLAVPPLPRHAAILEADEVAGLRIGGECSGALHDPERIAHQRIALPFTTQTASRQKLWRALQSFVVERPVGNERSEHEVVIDHSVVVDRRVD